jgi:hypothetical protein
MRSRGTLEVMKLKGTVKNGAVAVDLPDGTSVSIEVEQHGVTYPPGDEPVELDAKGLVVMTPALEASLRASEADADAGRGITVDELERRLRLDGR